MPQEYACGCLPLCLLAAAPGHAQTTGPAIFFVYPAGGQLGKTVEATVAGQQLKGATAVWVSGKGLSAPDAPEEKPDPKAKPKPGPPQPPPRPWISSNIRPSEAARIHHHRPGRRVGRTRPAAGHSRGRFLAVRFVVDEVAETVAVQRNSEKADAVHVPSLPAIINGQIFTTTTGQGGPDRGYWRLPVKAGQTLVCECQAQSILPYSYWAVPGWLDACLTLSDTAGKRLGFVDDFRFKPDPVLFHKVEKDGECLLEVRDILYRGSQDFIYRVRIGAWPYVTHVYPLGGRRNSTVKIELARRQPAQPPAWTWRWRPTARRCAT